VTKYEYTRHQELVDAAAYALGRVDMCTHQVTVLFFAILKVWRQIEKVTRSIDAYLLEEQWC